MATNRDDILALLEDPRVKPSLISMLVVGIAAGYAIKIAVDAFRNKQVGGDPLAQNQQPM